MREVSAALHSSSCHLVNANETPDRGPQGPTEFEREAR